MENQFKYYSTRHMHRRLFVHVPLLLLFFCMGGRIGGPLEFNIKKSIMFTHQFMNIEYIWVLFVYPSSYTSPSCSLVTEIVPISHPIPFFSSLFSLSPPWSLFTQQIWFLCGCSGCCVKSKHVPRIRFSILLPNCDLFRLKKEIFL